MPTPPNTADAFLTVVQKSGLIEPEILRDHVMRLRESAAPPRSLTEFAHTLATAGLLTEFHLKNMLKGRYKGFVVGKFKVMRPIGSGGMGTVYLCRHSTMGHSVAMKILSAKSTNDQVSVERFFREARAAAGLNHPNLVRAHDIDKQDNFYYLVMDYVEGVSLQDLISRGGALNPTRAAHYMAQASLGLQYIHNAGLAHRDIKPGNLIVDREGTVRILDLGLARYLDDRADKLTKQLDEHGILGTADYISPEQAVESHNVDNRTDIYSLGATFYYILAARAPFEGASAVQKLMYHQTHEPVRLENIAPEVPAALADIVRKMMAKNPDDRFQNPSEIVQALEPFTREPIDPPTDEEIPSIDAFSNGPNTGGSNGGSSANSSPSAAGSSAGRSRVPRAAGGSKTVGRGRNSNSFKNRPPVRRNLYLALGGLAIAAGAAALFLFGLPGHPKDGSPAGDPTARANRPEQGRTAASDIRERPVEPARTLVPAKIFVAGAAGGDEQVPTLQEAIDRVRPGAKIVVRGDRLAGQPAVFPAGFSGVLQGECETPGYKVVWELAAGETALAFERSSAKISGFHFDGRGAANDLIRISGPSPGFALQDCELEGFRRAGVRLADAAGTPDQPVLIRRVRFESGSAAGGTAEAGVAFAGAVNRWVNIFECRFEGQVAGCKIQSEIAQVAIRRNRFYMVNDGLAFTGAARAQAVDATVENNVFVEIGRSGFRFDGIPAFKTGKLAVRYNLFANPGHARSAVGSIDGIGNPPVSNVSWIWTKEDTFFAPTGNKGAKPGTYYFRKTFKADAPAARAALEVGCVDAFSVWLNGELVGKGEARFAPKRVYNFEVGGRVRAGANTIAVECNHEADSVARGAWASPALFVQLSETDGGKTRNLAVSDTSWKGSTESADDWNKPGFDESKWSQPMHAWSRNSSLPWDNPVMESWLESKAPGLSRPAWLKAESNLRDYYWTEGAPLFDTMRGSVANNTLSLLANDDATFLRYPRHNALNNLDFLPDGQFVGFPQD